MGRVIATLRVENFGDVLLAERGFPLPDGIRSVEVESLVDTGCNPALPSFFGDRDVGPVSA